MGRVKDSKVQANATELGEQIRHVDTAQSEPHHLSEKVHHGDQALQILRTHYEPFTPEEERRVLRKIDMRLMPFMLIINGLQFVDKNTMAFAATYGIVGQAKLKGQEFSWLISIFYIAYLVAQYPTNYLMQRYPTGRYIMVNFLLWGVTLACTAAATNFRMLAVARFFLGIFESCLNPGFVLITSSWWKREEQASRTAIWYCANGLFGAPAAAIFWGIAHINAGNMYPYQWMFMIFGIITVAIGGVLWWFFPDSPVTATFLTERERLIAVERLKDNKTGIKNDEHKTYQIKELFGDIRVWLLALGVFIHNITNPLQTTFAGVIIKGFGYSTYEAVLLNIPPGLVMATTMLLVGFFLSSRFGRNKRIIFILLCYLPGVAACLILYLSPVSPSTKSVHLLAIFIVPIPAASSGIMYSLLASNIAGYTKKTVAGVLFFALNAVSNIVAPQAFLQKQAPRYETGIEVCLAAFVANMCLFAVLYILYRVENSKRDRSQQDSQAEETVEDLIEAFSDLTDKQNSKMRYVL